MTHTGGEWVIRRGHSVVEIRTAAGLPIAQTTSDVYWENFKEETLANARLIAAAPELLAALEAFMGADDKMQVAIGGNPIYVDRFLARVRALLAKAKGGES